LIRNVGDRAYTISHAATVGDRGKRQAARGWLSARKQLQQTLSGIGLQHVNDNHSAQRDKP